MTDAQKPAPCPHDIAHECTARILAEIGNRAMSPWNTMPSTRDARDIIHTEIIYALETWSRVAGREAPK